LPDELLVAEVDAIKETNREANFFAIRLQFIGGVNDVHQRSQVFILPASGTESLSFPIPKSSNS